MGLSPEDRRAGRRWARTVEQPRHRETKYSIYGYFLCSIQLLRLNHLLTVPVYGAPVLRDSSLNYGAVPQARPAFLGVQRGSRGKGMLHEQELLELAEAYRYMAKAALDPGLRHEFAKRAQHYETVASLVKRRPEEPQTASVPTLPLPACLRSSFEHPTHDIEDASASLLP